MDFWGPARCGAWTVARGAPVAWHMHRLTRGTTMARTSTHVLHDVEVVALVFDEVARSAETLVVEVEGSH